jgi:hypothetical protein
MATCFGRSFATIIEHMTYTESTPLQTQSSRLIRVIQLNKKWPQLDI